MARKQIYIQQHIFDDDETFIMKRHTHVRYTEKEKGARDMLLAHLSLYNREKMKHLPKIYMSALIDVLLNSKEAFRKWTEGYRFKFATKRNNDGDIIQVKVAISNNSNKQS